MKLSAFLIALLALAIYAVTRLNRLMAAVEAQKAQMNDLQLQVRALRAKVEGQIDTLELLRADVHLSEAAMAEGLAQRQARWRELLADLDSLN